MRKKLLVLAAVLTAFCVTIGVVLAYDPPSGCNCHYDVDATEWGFCTYFKTNWQSPTWYWDDEDPFEAEITECEVDNEWRWPVNFMYEGGHVVSYYGPSIELEPSDDSCYPPTQGYVIEENFEEIAEMFGLPSGYYGNENYLYVYDCAECPYTGYPCEEF